MHFEWDEEKRQQNLVKHRMDFLAATVVFDGRPAFTYTSRYDAEERLVTVSLIGPKLWAVVWMIRDENIRIISVRRAWNVEERKYRELFG